MAVVTRKVIRNIEFLDTYTDKEKDILGKYSSSLFTLNTFYVTNKTIVGRNSALDAEKFLDRFWKNVVENMRQWKELQNHEITKIDLREGYIATQSIVIQALGRIGNYYYTVDDSEMCDNLKRLRDINWSRNARQWVMRAVGKNGRIITNKKAAMLIANVIKQQIGIPLSADEEAAERDLKKEIEG
jgi:DNA sulfur modification protein DndB